MIALLRNRERRHVRLGKVEMWCTFPTQQNSALVSDDFGGLSALNEIRLPPGQDTVPYPRGDAEIVTFVHKGALAKANSIETLELVHAGEFQHVILGDEIRHKETNPSGNNTAILFQISLRPSESGLASMQEQRRFATSQRHNVLCVVASPDGRHGSLRVRQDVAIYSGIFDPGHHLVHELLPERSAWLHVISGEATLQDISLTDGDGVGVTSELAVSLTAQTSTEMLLIDLGPSP